MIEIQLAQKKRDYVLSERFSGSIWKQVEMCSFGNDNLCILLVLDRTNNNRNCYKRMRPKTFGFTDKDRSNRTYK